MIALCPQCGRTEECGLSRWANCRLPTLGSRFIPRLRESTHVVDEELRDWAERAVFQRDDRDRHSDIGQLHSQGPQARMSAGELEVEGGGSRLSTRGLSVVEPQAHTRKMFAYACELCGLDASNQLCSRLTSSIVGPSARSVTEATQCGTIRYDAA